MDSSAALERIRAQTLEVLSVEPLMIGGEAIPVGPLSLDQLVAIAHFAARVLAPLNTQQLQPLVEASRQGVPGVDVTRQWSGMLLDLLNREQVRELASIILDRPEEWCGKNVTVLHIPLIIARLRDCNEPALLIDAFSSAVKGWSPRSTDKSGQLSPASDATASPNGISGGTPSGG